MTASAPGPADISEHPTKIDPWLPTIEKAGGLSEAEARTLLGS